MKSALILSPILAISFLVSCAPKDSKLVPPGQESTTSLGGKASNSQFESNKHLMLLLDRQVEAIHLFKAVIDADYAQKKNLKIEDIASPGTGLKKISSDSIRYKSGAQEQVSQVNFIVQIDRNANQEISMITIRNNTSEKAIEESISLSEASSTPELILKNKSKEIIIKKSSEVGVFDVSVKLIDESNSILGKGIALNDSTFQFSLSENNALITSMTVQHNRYGSENGDMAMKSAQSTLTINLGANCTSVNGSVTLEAVALNEKTKKPLYVRTANYSDSSISLAAGKDILSFPAIACDSRPVVDLKKLF